MQVQGGIYDHIIDNYNSLTKAEQRVADYVLTHKGTLMDLTISELAKECAVGEATLTRFCRDIGCKGFNNFKLELAKKMLPAERQSAYTYYSEVQAEDPLEDKSKKICRRLIEALERTLSLLEYADLARAVDWMIACKGVYCFGEGNSSIAAMEAWGRFSTATPKFHWVSDSHMQAITASLLTPDDIILYFSYSGATRELVEIAELKEKTGSKMILVTRFQNSPGAAMSDIVLPCGANESPLQQGSVSAKVAQLYVIDILFNEFSSRNLEQSIENRNKTAGAISRKLL
jgi:DNA-binding MurR/RpiR family transcriptional regulator